MKIIGLTGGIGTGKSTAIKILREIHPGIVIIDADVLSHEAVEPGEIAYILLKWFILPKDCFEPITKKLIRSKLAELIFAPTPKGRALKKIVEGCIHPWVIYKMVVGIVWYWLSGKVIVVLDIPLLFEANLQWMCSKTVLIDTSDSGVQLSRILKRNPQMSEEDAMNRIAAQFPMQKKRKMADRVIKNDGTVREIEDNLLDEFKNPDIMTHVILYLLLPILLVSFSCIYILKGLMGSVEIEKD